MCGGGTLLELLTLHNVAYRISPKAVDSAASLLCDRYIGAGDTDKSSAGPPRILNASAKRTSSRSARAAVTARCGRSRRSGWSMSMGRSTPPCSGHGCTGTYCAPASAGPRCPECCQDSPLSGGDKTLSAESDGAALIVITTTSSGREPTTPRDATPETHGPRLATRPRWPRVPTWTTDWFILKTSRRHSVLSVAGPECALGADFSVAFASAAAQTGWHQAPRNVGTTCHAMKVC